jgi:putative ABC transport system permease protein
MTGWGRQVRLAVRTLRKAPAFTTTTVLLIGLGVGAVTTIFTLVDHVLLRPLPYPAAERLITVEMGSHSGTTYREFEKLDGMEAWAGGYSESANLTGEGRAIRSASRCRWCRRTSSPCSGHVPRWVDSWSWTTSSG